VGVLKAYLTFNQTKSRWRTLAFWPTSGFAFVGCFLALASVSSVLHSLLSSLSLASQMRLVQSWWFITTFCRGVPVAAGSLQHRFTHYESRIVVAVKIVVSWTSVFPSSPRDHFGRFILKQGPCLGQSILYTLPQTIAHFRKQPWCNGTAWHWLLAPVKALLLFRTLAWPQACGRTCSRFSCSCCLSCFSTKTSLLNHFCRYSYISICSSLWI